MLCRRCVVSLELHPMGFKGLPVFHPHSLFHYELLNCSPLCRGTFIKLEILLHLQLLLAGNKPYKDKLRPFDFILIVSY